MVSDIHSLHHIHKRKRMHKELEKYPSPNRFKRFIDKSIFVVAIVAPIMAIPQAWKIWVGQNASGVSAVTWGTHIVTSCFWLTYGILHKEKPIILTGILWVFMALFITIGTLIYG